MKAIGFSEHLDIKDPKVYLNLRHQNRHLKGTIY